MVGSAPSLRDLPWGAVYLGVVAAAFASLLPSIVGVLSNDMRLGTEHAVNDGEEVAEGLARPGSCGYDEALALIGQRDGIKLVLVKL